MNSESKNDLRKKMRHILTDFHASLSEKEKHSLAENLCEKITALPEYQNASTILAYIPGTLEANCTPVILHALEEGKKVAVPKVDSESLKTGENRMDFYFLPPVISTGASENERKREIFETQLEVGAYGIREPKSCLEKFSVVKPVKATSLHGDFAKLNHHIFILVPGVAFTQNGKRLGHGKGFYDIYIEKMRKSGANPFLCGIALPCQICADLPTDAHDILMDTVIF